jgi:hypothetical protein
MVDWEDNPGVKPEFDSWDAHRRPAAVSSVR